MTDAHGTELKIGDKVVCDDSESGVVQSFGGLGIFVAMDSDSAVIDWAKEQVEKQ